ncbi:hypothetical protein ABW20_dc0100300 [Dactylellina cionopaga]|nr:hypothetical protein ABW20_dc0100300 [Dactylellina cionopaga]
MKVSQILSALIALAVTATAAPTAPKFSVVASGAPVKHFTPETAPEVNPVAPRTSNTIPGLDKRQLGVQLTGGQLKQSFMSGLPQAANVTQAQIQFFTNLQQTVWDQLSTLSNKIAPNGNIDQVVAAQVTNAWTQLFAGQIPDFANLSTTRPKTLPGQLVDA